MKKIGTINILFLILTICFAIVYILIGWGVKDYVVSWGVVVLLLTILSVCFSSVKAPTKRERNSELTIYILLTVAQIFPAVVAFSDFSWYHITIIHLLTMAIGCYVCHDVYKQCS